MLRRLLPTLAGLALGFTVLIAGLIRLEQVFRGEREEARETTRQQRSVLEKYAWRALSQSLENTFRGATAAIDEALRDPLLPAAHWLRIEDAQQLLPRLNVPSPGSATPARQLFMAMIDDDPPNPQAEKGSPWHDWVGLHRAFLDAVQQGSSRRIESTCRAILQHRVRYRVASTVDLPATLALLYVLHHHSTPAPELLRAMLHDGLDDGSGGEVPALPRLLLEHRNRFTRPDFLFLSERLVELAEASEIPYEVFLERSRETTQAPIPLPGEIDLPMVVDFGRWFAQPNANGTISGFALDLPSTLSQITAEMRQAGLLGDADSIHPAAVLPRHTPLEGIRLRVDSTRWARQSADIEERYRLKAALVLLSGGLAVALAILAVAHQARRLHLVELRSRFVATVSHELRTPLASVRLLAETVAKRARTADLRDYPARIVKEIDQLTFLVDNILSFNRLEKGRVTPHLSSVSLDELLDEVRSETEPQADRQVVFEAPVTGVTLRADPELIKLLFLNLVRNACRYNDRDPVRISIDHRTLDSGGSRLRVADNGRGLAEKEWSKVFEEFYQPRNGQGARGGTGLGLALCRRVAALHRGRIYIASSSPEGTTFHLELPLA